MLVTGHTKEAKGCCIVAADVAVPQVSIDYRPVHLQPLDSDMAHVPPKARVY